MYPSLECSLRSAMLQASWCLTAILIRNFFLDVLIKANKKGQVNESGKKDNIMFRRMLMFPTKMLRCFVIKTSFHHFHFVFYTQKHMVS